MVGDGLIVSTGEVVVAGKLLTPPWARVSESICRTREENVSRLGLGSGELLWRAVGETLLDVGVV